MARTANKEDIPNRLKEAGYVLFSRLGYNATGIQQITDQAKVPKGSFYNHFESKETFAVQIIEQYTQWVDAAWDACVQEAPVSVDQDPVGVMRYIFGRFIRHHEQAPCPGCLVGNFAAEVAESSELCRHVLAEAMRDWHARLADLISQAQARKQVRSDMAAQDLAAAFWDAWEGALLRMKVEHDSRPLKNMVAWMLDHFFRP